MRVAFCVSGRGTLFRDAVAEAPHIGITPVRLITDVAADPALAEFASRHGLVRQALRESHIEEDLRHGLAEASPDLVVLTFDRIIPEDLVHLYEGRMINVHPSLLPAFPGKHAIDRLLASGALFGGASIHEVTSDVDAGPVIAQAVVATDPFESPDAYGRRMYAVLRSMFVAVLSWYASGRITHDSAGNVRVVGARYGSLPISPWLDQS